MKTNRFLTLLSIILVISALFSLNACKKDDIQNLNASSISSKNTTQQNSNSNIFRQQSYQGVSYCGEIKTVDLKAGQHIDAGDILIYNDETNLYIKYETSGDWKLNATHLYVGLKADMPVNAKGNPKIGNFPYKNTFNPTVSSFIYTIPLNSLPECFIVAAHAEVLRYDEYGTVIQAETAWGNGIQIVTSGSWAMYNEYCKQVCNNCQIEPEYFDIFGGQTIPVGNLMVTNDEVNLYVTYQATGDWYYQRTHLYVGSLEGLPINASNTPVPGQFPYSITHSPTTQSYTYTIPLANLPSCYIIAAHAEAVKVLDGTIVQEETAWSFGEPFPKTSRWGWYSSYCTQICE